MQKFSSKVFGQLFHVPKHVVWRNCGLDPIVHFFHIPRFFPKFRKACSCVPTWEQVFRRNLNLVLCASVLTPQKFFRNTRHFVQDSNSCTKWTRRFTDERILRHRNFPGTFAGDSPPKSFWKNFKYQELPNGPRLVREGFRNFCFCNSCVIRA